MSKKIKIGIIFGGKSAEHEISLQSAKNVVAAIDKEKFDSVLIGVDKNGKWLLIDDSVLLQHGDASQSLISDREQSHVAIIPQSSGKISNFDSAESEKFIDVAFPILHGPYGEDGTMQGLLKLANIPFVGAGVLGSAVGMDKDVMKRLLKEAQIPIGKFLTFREGEQPDFNQVAQELGLPFFVKPANMGSSVGVSKVASAEQFQQAINEAFQFDRKIVIEENIAGREIECSVLGNSNPIASVPGEVISNHDFYSYQAKYLDDAGAVLQIPADLPEETIKKVQEMAVKTFKVLDCEGLGRVDFFLKDNGEVLVNEINTIPGFTSVSMYPKMWEASGISYSELIEKLVELAFERFEREQKLKTSYIN